MKISRVLASGSVFTFAALALTGCGSSSAPAVTPAYYTPLIAQALAPITSNGGSVTDFTHNSKSKTALYEGVIIVTSTIDCSLWVNPDLTYEKSQISGLAALGDSDVHYGKDIKGNYVGQYCTGNAPAGSGVTLQSLGQAIWKSVSDTLQATPVQP